MAGGGLRPAGRHGDLPLPGSRVVSTAVVQRRAMLLPQQLMRARDCGVHAWVPAIPSLGPYGNERSLRGSMSLRWADSISQSERKSPR